jgi:hypothetical protein
MNFINKNNKNSKKKKISKRPYTIILKKLNNDNFIINNSNNINDNNKSIHHNIKSLPLSGSELDYDPDLWNLNNHIKTTHNCYTYALGKIVPKLSSKAQPGYSSGFNHISNNEFNCKTFKKRLKKDAPGSYLEKYDNSCLPGFYKIFLALDPGNDYHWWRQDSNTFWSHKPGATNVTNLDANNEKIINPLYSNRNFSHRNYYKPCFFACVYSDLTRSIDQIYEKSK